MKKAWEPFFSLLALTVGGPGIARIRRTSNDTEASRKYVSKSTCSIPILQVESEHIRIRHLPLQHPWLILRNFPGFLLSRMSADKRLLYMSAIATRHLPVNLWANYECKVNYFIVNCKLIGGKIKSFLMLGICLYFTNNTIYAFWLNLR